METDDLYEGRKGENEFSEKGTDLKPRPYVNNVSVAFVVIDYQIDNGGHHNESEDGLGLEKAVRSLTISQTYAGYHSEYTGIFLHVKLQIEQPPFKNNIRNRKDTAVCLLQHWIYPAHLPCIC